MAQVLANTRILIVEGDAVLGEALRGALSEEGASAECVTELSDSLPDVDLIVADAAQLGTDLEALSELCVPGRPVIVTSLSTRDEVILGALRGGAFRFLAKPFELDELVTRLRRALIDRKSGGLESGEVRQIPVAQGRWWELSAPSRQESLDRFQDFCQCLVADRMDAMSGNELRIAIQELGQNSIEWGNRASQNGQLRMALQLLADRIVIRITDSGSGFDPATLQDPTHDPLGVIEERERRGKRPGGFGIHLARKILDELRYVEPGNVVVMEKRFVRNDA